MNNTEINKHNKFQVKINNKVLYTITNLLSYIYIAMKHNELNVERESKRVNGGFFLDIRIRVNSITN